MKPEKVAVCQTCIDSDWEWNWFPPNEVGSICPQDHDEEEPVLVEYELYICRLPDHCEHTGFHAPSDLVEHQFEYFHDLVV